MALSYLATYSVYMITLHRCSLYGATWPVSALNECHVIPVTCANTPNRNTVIIYAPGQ